MSRNRRNKRSFKHITDYIDFKMFITIVIILIIVISISLGIMAARNYYDRLILAKQKEELEKQVESIYAETIKNIELSNETKRDEIIKISAVGDILCGDEMIEEAKVDNGYNFDRMFGNINGFLQNGDIIVGTMETNFTSDEYSGYGNRNAPKQFAQAVKKYGVNLVSISHNHSLDYGLQGLKQTKEYLDKLGFSTVGDRISKPVTIKTIKNTKIAFISYTYGVQEQENKTKKELESISIFSEEIAKKDIKYAKENADYIIAIMHWGDELKNEPNEEQKHIADFLINNGVGVILGNHPATVQPMEVKKNKKQENVFVAYSLGNYISSMHDKEAKIELILNIELRKKAEDGKVVISKVDYTPIYLAEDQKDVKYKLIDMKGVAKAYAGGDTEIISKETYEELISGLEFLKNIINK